MGVRQPVLGNREIRTPEQVELAVGVVEAVVGLGGDLLFADAPCIADIAAVAPLREAERPAAVIDGRRGAVENLARVVAPGEARIVRYGQTAKRLPLEFHFAAADA